MDTRFITQEVIAEYLRNITAARARADSDKSADNLVALAQRQGEAAEAYVFMDAFEDAKFLFLQILDTLSQLNRPEVSADFCERAGKVFLRAGKNADASAYFLRALATRETMPKNTPENRAKLVNLYQLCADSLARTSRIDDAVALLNKKRDLLKSGYESAPSLSDLTGWADTLYALGNVYGHYETHTASYKLYREAMSLYIEAEKEFKSDTRREVADCLVVLGGIHELERDYDRALEHYLRALEINRRLAIRDGDEPSLNHLASSCTHTAELYETMGRLVDALGLYREKADVNLRLSKIKPVIETPEVLFLSPPENFSERLERLESTLPWHSLLFELEENPCRNKMYITYFTMGRLTEELAGQNNDNRLFKEALRLFEASRAILDMIREQFPDQNLEQKLREVTSGVKRIKNRIRQESSL